MYMYAHTYTYSCHLHPHALLFLNPLNPHFPTHPPLHTLPTPLHALPYTPSPTHLHALPYTPSPTHLYTSSPTHPLLHTHPYAPHPHSCPCSNMLEVQQWIIALSVCHVLQCLTGLSCRLTEQVCATNVSHEASQQ